MPPTWLAVAVVTRTAAAMARLPPLPPAFLPAPPSLYGSSTTSWTAGAPLTRNRAPLRAHPASCSLGAAGQPRWEPPRSSSTPPAPLPAPPGGAPATAAADHDGGASRRPPLPATVDTVVIGSGIGGLCAAALLSVVHGQSVVVLEAHSLLGGAAHAFTRPGGYTFDSGPSLFSGLAPAVPGSAPSVNPLRNVLDAVGVSLPVMTYNTWGLATPDGRYTVSMGDAAAGGEVPFGALVREVAGPAAEAELRALIADLAPIGRMGAAMPAAAFLAGDVVGSALTAGKYFTSPAVVGGLPAAVRGDILAPFTKVMDRHITHPFTRAYLDLLCFLLAGVAADGTLTAQMAYIFHEWTTCTVPGGALDYPLGGSGALIDALVGAIRGAGGVVAPRAPVAAITIDPASGAATGVELADGTRIAARRAVVSNATSWDTARLLPPAAREASRAAAAAAGALDGVAGRLRPTPSFVHLHLGVDCQGMDPAILDALPLNATTIRSWELPTTGEQNAAALSFATVADPSMAPPGHHVVHAYAPATEPYSLYEGMDRRSPEYKALKAARVEYLYEAVERFLPGIRAEGRIRVALEGSPLTHERYLRRHRGTYGPEVMAGTGDAFTGGSTGVAGLWAVGDSCFPGIGVPAVAASALLTVGGVVGRKGVQRMLQDLKL